MRLSRPGKILRNLLLTALLAALTVTAVGFPPLTVSQMCRRRAGDLLLPDLTPVYHMRYKPFVNGGPHTFVIARSGDTYTAFQYRREGLTHSPEPLCRTRLENDCLLTYRNGSIYIAGDFSKAASATAVVTAQRTTQYLDYETRRQTELQLGEQRVFTYDCIKENDHLLTFHCGAKHGEVNTLSPEDDLAAAAEHLYHRGFTNIPPEAAAQGVGGFYPLEWDIPVEVTLRDEAGAVLDTLSLTAATNELQWFL